MRMLPTGIALVLVGLASQAKAGEMVWRGTLSLELLAAPVIAITGTGVATVNGSGGGARLETLRLAGGITGSGNAPVTDPANPTIYNVFVAPTLGTGTLAPFWPTAPFWQPQLTQNTLPIRGIARLCQFVPGCVAYLPLGLTAGGGATGMGVGGLLTVGGAGSIRISVEAAPWTVRTVTLSVEITKNGVATTVVNVPAHGWLHGPQSLDQSAALPGGELSVVTPMQVTSSLGQGFGMFGRLTVRFLPEPGFLLLLGSGVAGLTLLGRNRIRF